MLDKAPRKSSSAFVWDDPFLLEDQLSEDERGRLRSIALTYLRNNLQRAGSVSDGKT